MSQGVVTNYFAKKRRGGYIQPSKRLKLAEEASAKVQNDAPILVQPEKIVHEIRQTRKSTRKASQSSQRKSTRTSQRNSTSKKDAPSLDSYFKQLDSVSESNENLNLRLSPASSDSGSSVGSEVITAADDDHDIPQTPKRRREKGQDKDDQVLREKRGRVTPKKMGFDFKVSESAKSDELQADTEFTASTRSKRKGARRKLLPVENSAKGTEATKLKKVDLDILKNDENPGDGKNSEKAEKDEKSIHKRTTRSRKNAISEVSQNSSSACSEKTKNLAEKLLAKKKESPDTLKEALKSSGNLKDLQATLMKIREQKKKQKEKEKAKKIQKKKTVEEPKKDVVPTEKREFAYETLHSLAQEIPRGLPLPFKYKILAELFRCADTVVSMLFNRQQVTTWTTLQKSVKEMVRKNFELDHLGQIKTVFPSAYQYRYEKGLISYSENNIRPSDYQLTIEPNLDETERDNFGEGSRKLTSGMLVRRRHHFLVQLVNIVKDHHKKFLSTLNPPIEIQDDKILRWHPQFPLDRVPDVQSTELPKRPDHDKERCHSAKEVLDKARNKFTKKAVDALKKVAERASPSSDKTRSQLLEENNNITSKKSETAAESSSALKGVSQSLLAKIRAKEAEKKMKSMVRTEENTKKLEQLAKLPDVARALRMLYITEKKAALPLDYICEKLVQCCSGILIPAIVREHVMLLAEHLPSWLSQTKIRNVNYIKLDKGKEMAEILQHLQGKIKQAEKA